MKSLKAVSSGKSVQKLPAQYQNTCASSTQREKKQRICPGNKYMIKINSKALENGVQYVHSYYIWLLYGVIIVNFEHFSHLLQVFLLLTLN